VQVEFFGPLRDIYNDKSVAVTPGTTVEQLLQQLNVDDRYFIVLFDDDPAPFSAEIPATTHCIRLVPPIGGGCL
jgi:sulfur carrier protein ThiS